MRAGRVGLTTLASAVFGAMAFLAAVSLMTAISDSVRSATIPVPQVGSPAPNFALTDLDGTVTDLTQFRGQKVVLVFWADWCPDCKAIVPDLNLINDGEAVVLAINLLESKERVQAAAAKARMRYEILLDRKGEVGRLYGVQAIPSVFVIDENGVIIEHTFGVPTLVE